MAIKHLVVALAVASLTLVATAADAKGVKVKSSSSSTSSAASSSTSSAAKKAARDEEPAFSADNLKKTKKSDPATDAGGTSVNVGPRLSSSSSTAPGATSAVNNAVAQGPAAAAAPAAVDDEAKRKRTAELAAMQRKFDEDVKARQAEDKRDRKSVV